METELGKGAVYTPKPIRDRHYRIAASAPMAATDWSAPYRVPATLTQKNQDGSSSCTAQATTYFCEALNQIENGKTEVYSPRFIYSQTNLGANGGSYMYSALSIPNKQGVASMASVPCGNESESIMIDKSDNVNAVLEAKTDKYAVVPRSTIDQMAQIVKDYHGFVTSFNGYNGGMFNSQGEIVDWSKVQWGHAVYVIGYEIRHGIKYLVFKNSWGSAWGTDGCGYMPEAFVNSGLMFDAYTYALLEDLDPMSMFRLVKVGTSPEVWLVRDGKRTHIYNQGALMAIADFSKVETVSQQEFDGFPDSGLDLATLVKE